MTSVDGLRAKIIHFTDWAVDRPSRDFLPYLTDCCKIVGWTPRPSVPNWISLGRGDQATFFNGLLIAKGGLVTLTKALAVELAPTITVNAVAPGTVEPPPSLSESKLQEIRDSSALGRIGSANDVIQAVLYLLEGTDFATGEVLRVDGGRFLGPPAATSSDLDQ